MTLMMTGMITLGIIFFLLGIYIGIKINKWSNNLNQNIEDLKKQKINLEIFTNLLNNIKSKKSKFKNRFNNQVFIGTTLPELGKVEIIFLMDTREIAITQNHQCLFTSDSIDKKLQDDLCNTIFEVYNDKINDTVDVMGMVVYRVYFEKTFKLNTKKLAKMFPQPTTENEIKRIIEENDQKYNVDEILDKISKVGIHNLTQAEIEFLENYRNNLG